MKRMWFKHLSLFICAAVWLSSCAEEQAVPEQIPAIPDFSSAYAITIIEDWYNYDLPVSKSRPFEELNSVFTLERPASGSQTEPFRGSAEFTVLGHPSVQRRETVEVAVPADAIRSFLQELSRAEVYSSENPHPSGVSDEGNEITIRLLYGDGETIEFNGETRGQDTLSWNVILGEKDYFLYSDIPMEAYWKLIRYLAPDVLRSLAPPMGMLELPDPSARLEYLACGALNSVDATNLVDAEVSVSCPIGYDYIYQTFLTSSPEISSVVLRFRVGGILPAEGYTSHLTLRDCRVDGPILAELDQHFDGGWAVGELIDVEFKLPETLYVPVGHRLVLQWTSPPEGPKIVSWMSAEYDSYPDGNEVSCTLKEVLEKDLIFEIRPH